jgi:transposase
MPVTKETIDRLLEQNAQLLNQIASMQKTIDELTKTIARLEEKLNKNSRNSSKPPSSDGFKKQNRSLREKTDKNPGGQEGHKGTTLSVIKDPDRIVPHIPSQCIGCPHYAICMAHSEVVETRTVVDAVVKTEAVAHQAICIKDCPVHHTSLTGTFPKEINAPVKYGKNLQALVTAFNTVGAVSANRIKEILGSVFGVPLSTGTVTAMVSRFSSAIASATDKIKSFVSVTDVAHCDETGLRVDKKTKWAHVFSNEMYTYLTLSDKRGRKGMDEAGILPYFKGIAMHDCWSSYWKYPEVVHAVCCAHLLRELKGMQENHPDQTWHKRFSDLLMKMKKAKDRAVKDGHDFLSEELFQDYSLRYDEIIRIACEENPLPVPAPGKKGRRKKGKVRALIDRLSEYKDSVMMFVRNFRVDFDNNLAERDLRNIKVKLKVSGCFRTNEGAKDYLRIMSFVGTARKHGKNAYEAIYSALSGDPDYIFC